MKIEVWHSFSCNNSSSYYMVARFKTATEATGAAAEIRQFFEDHARDSAAMWEAGDDPISTPTEAAKALAAKHGFEWTGYLAWGDEGMVDDEPWVFTVGETVLLYHSYCGGFGQNVPRYFEAVGADTGAEDRGNPIVAVTFAIPSDPAARQAASAIGEYIDSLREMAADEEGWVFQNYILPPWGPHPTEDMEFECGVPYPGWNDGHTIGFALELTQFGEWESIPMYLDKHNIADYRLTFDEPGIVKRFQAIAAATCRECGAAPLRFIDGKTHDAPDDQLACDDCGGMFVVGELVSVED